MNPFLAEAVDIGDYLVRASVRWREYATWVGHQMPEEARNERQMAPHATTLDTGLYRGTAGVALFLGQLYRLTKDEAYRDVARAAILLSLHKIKETDYTDEAVRGKKPVFGFYGGSIGPVWTGFVLGDIFSDPDLTSQAADAAMHLTDGFAASSEVDAVAGHAGGIPAMVSVARKFKRTEFEPFLRRLGDDLLASDLGVMGPNDTLSWRMRNFEFAAPLTGLAHGAAGGAYALAVLYDHTGDERYLDGCRRALAYERQRFDPHAGWPDLRRTVVNAPFSNHWCHGSGGIGLTRVALSKIVKDDRLEEEVLAARAFMLQHVHRALAIPDLPRHYCHGLIGDAECLLLIEEYVDRRAARERFAEIGELELHRFGAATRKEWPSTFVDWPLGHLGHRELGLMMGIAGIGYFFLRQAAPDDVPTVLLPGVP